LPRPAQLAGAVVDREQRVGERSRRRREVLPGTYEQQAAPAIDRRRGPHADAGTRAGIVRSREELPSLLAGRRVVRRDRAGERVVLPVPDVLEARSAL